MNETGQTKTRVLAPLERFLHVEAASGIVLIIVTVIALLWANSPWASSYFALWHTPVVLGIGDWQSTQSLHFWINDGLMTVFFLLVGLEIRREMYSGALSSLRLAVLPAAAALGGIIVPALLYTAVNARGGVLDGWAVPTATDIAFAVGVLALLGRRVPQGLRVLLLALAIIDDIAAVIVIAVFYSDGLSAVGLGIAALGVACTLIFQRLGIRSAAAYLLPGSVLWIGLLQSGVHPTLAGVILGLMTPVRAARGVDTVISSARGALEEFRERARSGDPRPNELTAPVRRLQSAQRELLAPVTRVETAVHPWVAYGVMPLFALANAGVSLEIPTEGPPEAYAVGLGILLGLLLGKPLGIVAGAMLALKMGFAEMTADTSRRGILVVGCLGGIGFTMAIFIANLAFVSPELLAAAKLAILGASLLAGLAGLTLGWLILPGRAAASLAQNTRNGV